MMVIMTMTSFFSNNSSACFVLRLWWLDDSTQFSYTHNVHWCTQQPKNGIFGINASCPPISTQIHISCLLYKSSNSRKNTCTSTCYTACKQHNIIFDCWLIVTHTKMFAGLVCLVGHIVYFLLGFSVMHTRLNIFEMC